MNKSQVFKPGKFKRGIIFLLVTGFSLLLVSCYPGEPLSPSDTDVVVTFRDKNADFSNKSTYAMPDSVIYVVKKDSVVFLEANLANQILSAIDNNMQQYGYNKVDNPNQADVVIVALATKTTWVAGSCYPWYWDWWWGYPGWCYPVAYTYNTGTILIVMVDAHQQGDVSRNALWVAGLNGLLDTASNSQARINRAIDQAFRQSPYLGEGK